MTAIFILLGFGVLLLALIFFGEGERIKVQDTFGCGKGCLGMLILCVLFLALIGYLIRGFEHERGIDTEYRNGWWFTGIYSK